MLGNLYIAMKKKKVRQVDIARLLKISKMSVSNKLKGKRELTRTEMFAIKNKYFPDADIEILFKEV